MAKGLISPQGGAQNASKMILKSLSNHQQDFKIFVLTDENKSLNLYNKNWCYINQGLLLKIFGLNFEINNLFATRGIENVIRNVKPNLIHVNGYGGFYPKAPANIKSLLTLHDYPFLGSYVNFSLNPITLLEHMWYESAKIIRIKNLKSYNFFHALSSETAKALLSLGVERKRILVLPNGYNGVRDISENSFDIKLLRKKFYKLLNLKNSDKLIIAVGLINRRKGIHFLIESLNYLPSNIHLILVGVPLPLVGKTYLKKILSGKYSGRIHFLGFQPKYVVYRLMMISDCYVSSSVSEACQLTPIEAYNSGLPIVITDVGAARDFFGTNYKYLVKPFSSKDLANKIIQALEDPQRKNLDVRIPRWEEVGQRLLAFYKRII
ncbi:MAG: glycosyltransferase family 4 protein [Candidatus Hodarchaeota archaeon]